MNVVEHRPPLRRIDLGTVARPEIVAVEECVYARANRINHERNVWDAVTATAQASQQGQGSVEE